MGDDSAHDTTGRTKCGEHVTVRDSNSSEKCSSAPAGHEANHESTTDKQNDLRLSKPASNYTDNLLREMSVQMTQMATNMAQTTNMLANLESPSNQHTAQAQLNSVDCVIPTHVPAKIMTAWNSAETIKKLIEMSFQAKDTAYCPYSKFPVGSALLCVDGSLYTGCNIENAAYPLGVCAEKAVIVKAVSEGHRKFTAIAVCSTMKNAFITPCGSCRQFLAEFGMDMDVYMTKADHSYVKMKVRELLPLGFEPERLDEERVESANGVTNIAGSPPTAFIDGHMEGPRQVKTTATKLEA